MSARDGFNLPGQRTTADKAAQSPEATPAGNLASAADQRRQRLDRKCQMPPPVRFSGPGETKASHVPGGTPCQTMPPSSPAPCASTNQRQLPQATLHGCARKWAVTSASGATQERVGGFSVTKASEQKLAVC